MVNDWYWFSRLLGSNPRGVLSWREQANALIEDGSHPNIGTSHREFGKPST